MNRRAGFLIACVLLAGASGWAQMLDSWGPGAEVQVRLQLEYGGTLPPMAKVEIFKGDMPFGADTANTRGEVTFRGLARGSYTIRVNIPGYRLEEAPVEITTGGDTRFIPIVLRPDPNAAAVDLGPSLDDPLVSAGVLGAPDKARKELMKAHESRINGDCKKAIEQAKKAIEVAPGLVMAYQEMGMCQTSMGAIEDAQKSFETAILKDPKFLYAYLNLARVLARKKDWQGAAKTLAVASKQHPQRGEPYFEMAKLQLATNDPLRAEATAKMALERDCSRIPEMAFLMANIHAKNGNKEQAIASLEEFVRKNPDTPQSVRARYVIDQLKAPAKPPKNQ